MQGQRRWTPLQAPALTGNAERTASAKTKSGCDMVKEAQRGTGTPRLGWAEAYRARGGGGSLATALVVDGVAVHISVSMRIPGMNMENSQPCALVGICLVQATNPKTKGKAMPQFIIRCRTERVLTVDADDEASARTIAEDTDFSAWGIHRLALLDPAVGRHGGPSRPGSAVRGTDAPHRHAAVPRRIRELLTKIADLALGGATLCARIGRRGAAGRALGTDRRPAGCRRGRRRGTGGACPAGRCAEDAEDDLVHDTVKDAAWAT